VSDAISTDRLLTIMKTKLIFAAFTLTLTCIVIASARAQSPAPSSGKKPNILVIFGDDIGQTNVSAYSMGMMGYRTPNIDRIAKEGMIFTDYYAEQSCTAGRSSFITGQCDQEGANPHRAFNPHRKRRGESPQRRM
jgi:Sulfatase